jgi:hypothetical protein
MTDDRLITALTALQDLPVPVHWEDVEKRLEAAAEPAASPRLPASPGADRAGSPRRARPAVAAAALALLAVGAVVAWPDDADDPVRTGPGPASAPPTAPTTTVDDDTTTTAPATRTLRTFPVIAVGDRDYLVWGGEAGDNDVSQRADGFAADLTTGEVREIPVAPIDPRSGATGVWNGTELIVCCGTGQADGYPGDTRSAAAWNPRTSEWRTLASPPAAVARSYPASVWTGELMVVMATGGAVATYDPASDTWAEAPAPPAIERAPEAVWTGNEVILWDARYGSGIEAPGGAIADRGWRWEPGDDAWQPLPDLPAGARTQLGSIGWTGSQLVVWGQSTDTTGTGTGARWRPGDDDWRPVAPSPQGTIGTFDGTPGSQSLAAATASGQVIVRALDPGDGTQPPLMAYDPATDRWTTTDIAVPGYHPALTVHGTNVLVPDRARPIAGTVPSP